MDFIDKLHLKGQAEEDRFFAELDKQLIKEMHEHQKHEDDLLKSTESQHPDSQQTLNEK